MEEGEDFLWTVFEPYFCPLDGLVVKEAMECKDRGEGSPVMPVSPRLLVHCIAEESFDLVSLLSGGAHCSLSTFFCISHQLLTLNRVTKIIRKTLLRMSWWMCEKSGHFANYALIKRSKIPAFFCFVSSWIMEWLFAASFWLHRIDTSSGYLASRILGHVFAAQMISFQL